MHRAARAGQLEMAWGAIQLSMLLGGWRPGADRRQDVCASPIARVSTSRWLSAPQRGTSASLLAWASALAQVLVVLRCRCPRQVRTGDGRRGDTEAVYSRLQVADPARKDSPIEVRGVPLPPSTLEPHGCERPGCAG